MNRYLLFLFWFICLSWSSRAVCSIENEVNTTDQAKSLYNYGSFGVKDKKFNNPAFDYTKFTTVSKQAFVSLRVGDIPANILSAASGSILNFEVDVTIRPYTNEAAPTTQGTAISTTLKVTYNKDKGTVFKGIDTYELAGGAYQLDITVTDVRCPEISATIAKADIKGIFLEATTSINRKYIFQQYGTVDVGAFTANTFYRPASKQLNVSCYAIGAEDYDIELTTLDNGSEFGSTIASMLANDQNLTDAQLESLFKNNATRVAPNVQNTDYTFPLIYDNDYIAVRVRTVNYDASGNRITGPWKYKFNKDNASTEAYGIYTNIWNDQNKNWQFSSVFAENGKSKETISYYDGSLRSRQTVSIAKTESGPVPVVQEDIYDPYGRKAASILPAPIYGDDPGVPVLHYFEALNRKNATTVYSAADVSGAATDCETLPTAISNAYGASQYYSPNNPFLAVSKLKNTVSIPNAEGFPFSVTQYTKDNTGRIKLQGGVGKVFQPGYTATGPNSNTTKYYYGKPEQWELDQMFGNDVGYAEHYTKNMVIDPNGQISLTYQNLSGKTIATALTGPTPGNLDPLPSRDANTKKTNTRILNPSQFTFNGSDVKITATTTYMAALPDNQVTFEVNIQQLKELHPNNGLCSNCFYRLKFVVTDDCGNVVNPGGTPIAQDIGSKTADCLYSDATPIKTFANFNFSKPGEYTISIEFALDRDVIENYTDNFATSAVNSGYLQKKYAYIRQKFLAAIDVSGSYKDCAMCQVLQQTTLAAFTDRLEARFTAYGIDVTSTSSDRANFTSWVSGLFDSMKAQCATMSGCDFTPCSSERALMLADVSPGGQYAMFTNGGMAVEQSINVLSNNFYKVFGPTATQSSPLTEDDYIVTADFTRLSVYDSRFTKDLMLAYWNPQWAVRFLKYHPEKCKLDWCELNTSSKNWDEKVSTLILRTGDIKYLNNGADLSYSDNTPLLLLNLDPFFQAGSTAYNDMAADLQNYTGRVLKLSAQRSLSQYVRALLSCKATNAQGQQVIDLNCTPSCVAPQKEWQLYKELYLKLKQQYFEKASGCSSAGSCPIGRQFDGTSNSINYNCPSPADFLLEWSEANLCSPSRTIKITYQGNNLRGNTILGIYYPDDIRTVRIDQPYDPRNPEAPALPMFVTRQLSIPAGERVAYICVPADADINKIGISSVKCENKETPINQQVYIDITSEKINRYVFHLLIWAGWPWGHHWPEQEDYQEKVTVSLRYADGSFTTVTSPVQVSLKYRKNFDQPNGTAYHDTDIYTYYDEVVTIPAGSSSVSVIKQAKRNYRSNYPNVKITHDIDVFNDQATLPAGYLLYKLAGTAITTTITNTAPPAAACDPLLAGKVSRFDPIPGGGSTAQEFTSAQYATVQAEGQTKLNEAINVSCAASVDLLISKLGSAVPADKVVELRAKLIDVCTAGGDITHMAGSSILAYNASPSFTSTPKSLSASGHVSYGSVIKQVFGVTSFTNDLNPYLLSSPGFYDVPRQAVTKTVASGDAALCSRLASLRSAYVGSLTGGQTESDAGFYSYLVTRFGSAMTITSEQLTALKTSCNSCNELMPKAIILPAFLDPSGTGYITKSQYSTAINDLNTQFNNSINSGSSNYEAILTNFMNMRFGFTLGYADYQQFGDNPSGTAILSNTPRFKEIELDPFSRAVTLVDNALATGTLDYDRYIADAKNVFRAKYIATCSAAQAYMNINTRAPQYHYTLYYYDQADNLVRTIPPEGVRLITDEVQLQKVQDARNQPVVSSCTTGYNGPTANSTPASIFGALEANFNGKQGGTIEMWLYNAGSNPSRVVQATPNGTYQFQLIQNGSLLSVEILSSPYNGSFQKNNRVVLDISGMTSLQAWNHITVYSSDFVAVQPQVLINGIMAHRATFQGRWSVAGADLSSLKFLRLYTGRKMPVNELQLNAVNNCFLALYSDHQWFRYNLPAVGDETTTGSGTAEFKDPGIYPAHILATNYLYNSTNQVVKQSSPDGGMNRYWYDLLSRLVFSQNDKQQPKNNYSYTQYEATLGRITEVGQKNYTGTALKEPDFVEDSDRLAILATTSNTQITKTIYDVKPTGNGVNTALNQENLRKRVSATYYQESPSVPATQATYYSYDVNGNVKTLWQQIDGLTTTTPKRLDYEYDLISGKVNFLRYQNGNPDQFFYQYVYDAENRITEAWSGTKAATDDYSGSRLLPGNARRDAKYYYYLHGPLARTVLGDILAPVQGVDYTYTLQGWLKGVNSTNLGYDQDPANDGSPNNLEGNTLKTKDAYGYALHYYGTEDYKPIKGNNPFADGSVAIGFKPLYNGNIAASAVNLAFPNATAIQGPILYVYGYDQLNRLTRQNAYQGLNLSTNAWTPVATNAFRESVSYDANGNIKTYDRYNHGQTRFDALTYKYDTDAFGNLKNNKLTSIKDAIASTVMLIDIDDQADNNYKYDETGNLIADGSSTYDWNVYGKLSAVPSAGLTYAYNPAQQRTAKITSGLKTYYVRDAQGNTLAVYEKSGTGTPTWKEQYLFGSDRLGNWIPNISNIETATGQANANWQNFGLKRYELNNHLGNLMMTVSDRQVKDVTGSTNVMSADVINAQDYYPFGMTQPGRQYALSSTYRYGFNGKENDNDVGKPSGVQQDYGMRIYDNRIGRFLSVDPIASQFPSLTPYQFSSNSPLANIDLDGLEAKLAISGSGGSGTAYKSSDILSFSKRAADLKKVGFSSVSVHNGQSLVNALKIATKTEGSISAIVSYTHSGANGIYLDNDEGFYTTNLTQNTKNFSNVSSVARAVNKGEIKFTTNAIWIFASCNAGNYDFRVDGQLTGPWNIAQNVAGSLGIKTIGARGFVGPKDGKETGEFSVGAENGVSFKNMQFILFEPIKTKVKTIEYKTIFGVKIPFTGKTVERDKIEVKQTPLGPTINPKDYVQ